MKVTKLKVGDTYYLPVKGNPNCYTSGVLVEILDGNKVLMKDKKGKIFKCHTRKLHLRPDKAVKGMRAQVRARQDMYSVGDKEKATYKVLQKKVRSLGHTIYLIFDNNGKYTVRECGGKISFDTLAELKKWVNSELVKLEEFKKNMNNYKYLQVGVNDGQARFYKIITVSFKKFEITIQKKECTDEISESNVLKKSDIKNRFRIISK